MQANDNCLGYSDVLRIILWNKSECPWIFIKLEDIKPTMFPPRHRRSMGHYVSKFFVLFSSWKVGSSFFVLLSGTNVHPVTMLLFRFLFYTLRFSTFTSHNILYSEEIEYSPWLARHLRVYTITTRRRQREKMYT
jgi:hypothetical protein